VSLGSLGLQLASERPDLLAEPVRRALDRWGSVWIDQRIQVTEIDPEAADTAAFCERYAIPLELSANCVVTAASLVVVGSGLRRSKLVLPRARLSQIPGAAVGKFAL